MYLSLPCSSSISPLPLSLFSFPPPFFTHLPPSFLLLPPLPDLPYPPSFPLILFCHPQVVLCCIFCAMKSYVDRLVKYYWILHVYGAQTSLTLQKQFVRFYPLIGYSQSALAGGILSFCLPLGFLNRIAPFIFQYGSYLAH